MKLVGKRISACWVLKLVKGWLEAGVMEEGREEKPTARTPQGGVILGWLKLELHPQRTRKVDLSRGMDRFDFLECHLRKRMSRPIWKLEKRRVCFLHRWPSAKSMKRVRTRIHELTDHRWRGVKDVRAMIARINFDHDHMSDNLRIAFNHPVAEIVGISHEDARNIERAIADFSIPTKCVFTDYRKCLEATKPDIVLLCPATDRHAAWVCNVAHYGVHVLLEKPFAWYSPHITARRPIDEGSVGDVIEVHFYDGIREPLFHMADKVEISPEEREREKPFTWFSKRDAGGGPLLDYLGDGATLGTWYHGGRIPFEVTTVVNEPPRLEVDEHSVTVVRYYCGLSKFETPGGTHSDPWTCRPQPKCGFVIVGREGSVASYDFEKTVRLQSRTNPSGEGIPVDIQQSPKQNPAQHLIDFLEKGSAVEGPLSPSICRIGQRIVDSAVLSAMHKRAVRLL